MNIYKPNWELLDENPLWRVKCLVCRWRGSVQGPYKSEKRWRKFPCPSCLAESELCEPFPSGFRLTNRLFEAPDVVGRARQTLLVTRKALTEMQPALNILLKERDRLCADEQKCLEILSRMKRGS